MRTPWNSLRALRWAMWLVLWAVCGWGLPAWARAAVEAPDALVERITQEALDAMQQDKAVQAGDISRITEILDQKVMPYLHFRRMTASAVGPAWRKATEEQRQKLEAEFKLLLVRTYANAMSQAKNVTFTIKPMRSTPQDQEVTVRTLVRGAGEPIQLDYRLEKAPDAPGGWKIFNLNVLGIWLVDTYRSQFAPIVNAKGVDGLVLTLIERNKATPAQAASRPAKG
ncbi:MlaC/ttg2D family ABC transporter substrate-binding protein [Candidatus Symbiobacter mobilis]|uniref:Toluene tolerance type protein n=1 Tax=Candidatus Symbiobacter mobilis CR TaxID=946483 RepID=U5N3W6_9BURK|nr:ABC transporter substrate-binding protein [Candidatus Symbiobacter mobilis]AGX86181.1 toluene tolerance type protein [Candidatus Symbiobacter mobilis CR]